MKTWSGLILLIFAIGAAEGFVRKSNVTTVEVGYGTRADKTKTDRLLNCSVNVPYGSTALVSVVWRKTKNNKTEPVPVDRVSMSIVGYNVSSTCRTPWTTDAAGDYNCTFYDGNNRTMQNDTFYKVVTAPFISSHAKGEKFYHLIKDNYQYYRHQRKRDDLVWTEGANHKLYCGADGYPLPTHEWYVIDKGTEQEHELIKAKKTKIISRQKDAPIWISDDGRILHFTNVQKDAHGYYLCISTTKELDPPLYIYTLVRVKDRLAVVWPIIALLCEVLILVIVICVFGRHNKKAAGKTETERSVTAVTASHSPAANANTSGISKSSGDCKVRQRPAPATAKKGN